MTFCFISQRRSFNIRLIIYKFYFHWGRSTCETVCLDNCPGSVCFIFVVICCVCRRCCCNWMHTLESPSLFAYVYSLRFQLTLCQNLIQSIIFICCFAPNPRISIKSHINTFFVRQTLSISICRFPFFCFPYVVVLFCFCARFFTLSSQTSPGAVAAWSQVYLFDILRSYCTRTHTHTSAQLSSQSSDAEPWTRRRSIHRSGNASCARRMSKYHALRCSHSEIIVMQFNWVFDYAKTVIGGR